MITEGNKADLVLADLNSLNLVTLLLELTVEISSTDAATIEFCGCSRPSVPIPMQP